MCLEEGEEVSKEEEIYINPPLGFNFSSFFLLFVNNNLVANKKEDAIISLFYTLSFYL